MLPISKHWDQNSKVNSFQFDRQREKWKARWWNICGVIELLSEVLVLPPTVPWNHWTGSELSWQQGDAQDHGAVARCHVLNRHGRWITALNAHNLSSSTFSHPQFYRVGGGNLPTRWYRCDWMTIVCFMGWIDADFKTTDETYDPTGR